MSYVKIQTRILISEDANFSSPEELDATEYESGAVATLLRYGGDFVSSGGTTHSIPDMVTARLFYVENNSTTAQVLKVVYTDMDAATHTHYLDAGEHIAVQDFKPLASFNTSNYTDANPLPYRLIVLGE